MTEVSQKPFASTPQIIISGPPGSGKTTLISHLNSLGYQTVPEAAREEIKAQLALKTNFLPWKDVLGFSRLVLERIQKSAHTNMQCFYDRGIPDLIAYLKLAGLSDYDEFLNAFNQFPYSKLIFLTPPWKEIYSNDRARKESWETAEKIYELLLQTYRELGFDIKIIPKDTLQNRTKWLLENCCSIPSFSLQF